MKDINKATSAPGKHKSTSLKGLNVLSININGMRGKKAGTGGFS